MTVDEMIAAFEAAGDRTFTEIFQCDGRFGTKRNDLHAFMLLESILPGAPNSSGYVMDMVAAAEHDEIYLDINLERLAEVVTLEQVEELESCGVHFDEDGDGLSMFV